ncbi:signal peptide peptidase SppA [Microvirga tunisiensis]|uniref:Signal peptide peptidase SppA n=1 Tax=Pannonibacter tanglangensis TaxID=2750084 RepID=A0A7X5F6E3_9HYPH|nr:signal peptide peptidase SppA [Pannonibacter sp. XCT-53]NBN80359.1 signal peptide peptidase SppA [Pannonibacter sp. XCT-53]
MSLDADAIVDRRRLRRKLTFWRLAAFVILAAALGAGILAVSGLDVPSKRAPHIARIAVEGVILDDRRQLEMIRDIGESGTVEGVLLSINSPGGSTTGGEALFEALSDLAEKKPLVAEIRTVGTSAGYMIALSSDHVVARYNSITGSIGVLFQYGNVEKLLDTLGVEMDAVKSSPLKAEPDFYSSTSPEARQVLETLVGDSYDWFVRLVADRRGLDEARARELANGAILSGYRAREVGLVDAIGGEETAIAWLESERKVPANLPVVTWKVPAESESLPFSMQIGRSLGEGVASALIGHLADAKGLISPSLTLDGLVSVWHAPNAAEKDASRGGGE